MFVIRSLLLLSITSNDPCTPCSVHLVLSVPACLLLSYPPGKTATSSGVRSGDDSCVETPWTPIWRHPPALRQTIRGLSLNISWRHRPLAGWYSLIIILVSFSSNSHENEISMVLEINCDHTILASFPLTLYSLFVCSKNQLGIKPGRSCLNTIILLTRKCVTLLVELFFFFPLFFFTIF